MSHIHVLSSVEVAKINACMDFEYHSLKIAQSDVLSILNEMVSVLTKIQVARSLLVDPLNCPDGEPSSSSNVEKGSSKAYN
jgi:hypothetical protein